MKARKVQITQPARRQILIVDDHPMTRKGVAQRIAAESDLEVCADVGTAKAALACVEKCSPHLVVQDLSLGERSGLDLIKDLHARYPQLPVLVFSMHPESLYAERALRAGARGYIMKGEGAEELMEAIRCVLKGQVYLSAAMRDRIVHRFANGKLAGPEDNAAALSDRELEVFDLIGRGLGTRQITQRLNLSTSTVETHRTHIKEKLNLVTATELMHAAMEWVAGRGY